MLSPKRLILLAALAASLSIGWTTEAHAQHRGTVVVAPRAVIVRPYPYFGFYDPFWYDPFWYDPFWYGPQWGYPYGYPYRYRNDPGSAMKLEVKPKQAEVYIDGYYAGIVDDFDGAFQRLRATPGEHEITLYLDGYRTVHQRVYLTPDNTFKIKYEMERLAGGETPEPRPQPPAPPQAGPGGAGPQPPMNPPPMNPPPPRGPYGRRPPQQQPQQPPPPPPPDARRGSRGPDASAFGTISIRVQPDDADVLVDGEKWRAPGGQERLVIELPEGRHTVEIQKSGYRSYVTDIDVHRGETTPLNVSLRTQEDR